MRHIAVLPLAAAAMILTPSLAVAHPRLVASTPVADATVKNAKQIDLMFNEELLAANTRIELVMTSMPAMANHGAMKMPIAVMMGKDGKSVKVIPKKALPSGGYELRWLATGDDKEVKSGKFAFQIK